MTAVSSDIGVTRIGQIAFTVADVPRAVAFYRDVLGLRFLFEAPPNLAFFDCGGTRLMLEDRSILDEVHGLRNDSVIYFRVAGIHPAYEELRGRGVEFTDAPHVVGTHPDGTQEWMAFFKDCDGKLLAIMAQAKPA